MKLKFLFVQISGCDLAGVVGVPILIGIPSVGQGLIKIFRCHFAFFHDAALQMQPGAFDDGHFNGLPFSRGDFCRGEFIHVTS